MTPPKTCFFTFNISNTTGALAAAVHVAGGGATCTNSATSASPFIDYKIE